MSILYTLREQSSKYWIFFILCLSGIFLVGVLKEDLLIVSHIAAVVLVTVYYGMTPSIPRLKERIAIVFQPILMTGAGSILILFLEEVSFKIILLALIILLHSFFLFHLRVTGRSSMDDVRKGMLDSMRMLTQINVFLLAAIFYAPLFYFNIRFGTYYAIPFLLLASALVWNSAWVEGIGMPQRMLYTCVVAIVLLEVSIAQLWLPSSYMVEALITSVVFFFMVDLLLRPQTVDTPSMVDRVLPFLIAIGVLVLLCVFAQWR